MIYYSFIWLLFENVLRVCLCVCGLFLSIVKKTDSKPFDIIIVWNGYRILRSFKKQSQCIWVEIPIFCALIMIHVRVTYSWFSFRFSNICYLYSELQCSVPLEILFLSHCWHLTLFVLLLFATTFCWLVLAHALASSF